MGSQNYILTIVFQVCPLCISLGAPIEALLPSQLHHKLLESPLRLTIIERLHGLSPIRVVSTELDCNKAETSNIFTNASSCTYFYQATR